MLLSVTDWRGWIIPRADGETSGGAGMRVDATATRMTVRRIGEAGGAAGCGENVLIELAGELDAEGRLGFREQIGELLGRGGGVVTIDVGGLRSVDIAGLAMILRADLLLRRVHSELRVRSATPAFVQLVRDTGLTGRLRIDEQPGMRG